MTAEIDRLLRRYADDDAAVEGDRDVPPGRVTRTMGLAPATRLIFRVARDDNGVAAGADEAVDRAASSSGAPLPAELRARFERSLRADLSGVRIHTGADSAAAAHAVGARAYTVGTDIHFAAGQYAPSDPFGLHLLAHEVAHTVQQTHGAARVVARDDDPNAKGGALKPLSDVLEVSTFELTKPGTVTAKPAGDNVDIESPPVDLKSDVRIKDSVAQADKDKIGKVQVGSIQNSTASSRIGVYTKNGTVVAERNIATPGAAADAQTDRNDPTKRNKASVAPFYQAPAEINSGNYLATALMHDQPGFSVPATMAGGVLTETKGQDSFVTSVAAKRDGELVQLKSETWSVPWAVKVDAAKTGAGKEVDADPKTKDQPTITDDSPITAAQAQQWDSIKSVEAAKAMPPGQLLAALVACRSKDQDSYKNCVQAVTELNWKYTVKVTCANSYALAGSERVTVTAKASTGGSQTETADLNTGGSMECKFNFGTLFQADSWQPGNSITITVAVTNNVVRGDKSFTDTWAAPFDSAGDKELAKSDGHYKISKTRT